MLERLERRGTRLAAETAEARRRRIAGELGEAVPGVAAEIEGGAIVLSGRGLARRHAGSAALRWRIAEVCDER